VSTVLWVALGAALGAPLRYLLDRYVQSRRDSPLPWGTLSVNLAGSFVLGVLTGLPTLGAAATAALGTGFCGALTTYSAFAYEVDRLARGGAGRLAAGYAAASVLAGFGAVCAGCALGSALAGPP
jgi:fluoride exporter